jgi:hypothetical protein
MGNERNDLNLTYSYQEIFQNNLTFLSLVIPACYVLNLRKTVGQYPPGYAVAVCTAIP